MTDKEKILKWCENPDLRGSYLDIPQEIIDLLDTESAETVAEFFNHNKLIKLPAHEIEFFDWLKKNDLEVWNDLWEDEQEEPYIVSVSLLPLLIDKSKGFPICDLLQTTNYYFTNEHIAGKEALLFLESIKERVKEGGELTPAQELFLEISEGPVDI